MMLGEAGRSSSTAPRDDARRRRIERLSSSTSDNMSHGKTTQTVRALLGVACRPRRGERLDRWRAARVAELSRSRIKALIRTAGCRRRGRPGDPEPARQFGRRRSRRRAAAGAGRAAGRGHPARRRLRGRRPHRHRQAGRPRGASGRRHTETGTLVNALIAHCGDSLSGIGGVERPGIVHRLDKDTTGLLVVAKNDGAHQGWPRSSPITAAPARWSAPISPWSGACPSGRAGRSTQPIDRHPHNREKMAVPRAAAARRSPIGRCIERFGRRKAAGRGARSPAAGDRPNAPDPRPPGLDRPPVLGDHVYGAGFTHQGRPAADDAQAPRALGRQALHATAGLRAPAHRRNPRVPVGTARRSRPASCRRVLTARPYDMTRKSQHHTGRNRPGYHGSRRAV